MSRYPLNLPTQLKQEAEELASRQGVSLNQFIMWSVAEKVSELRQELHDPAFPLITYRRGASGWPVPLVRGTGIRVQTLVVASEQWEMTPAQLVEEYELSLEQVQQALAFYQAHKAEIDSQIATEAALEPQNG